MDPASSEMQMLGRFPLCTRPLAVGTLKKLEIYLHK